MKIYEFPYVWSTHGVGWKEGVYYGVYPVERIQTRDGWRLYQFAHDKFVRGAPRVVFDLITK